MQRPALAIVLLGPPGAGKGTQAERLSNSLGIPAISTGEMLRRECNSGSPLGLQVQHQLANGQLVKDELVQEVLVRRLRESDCVSGCILDGFPRTVRQARFLNRLLTKLSFAPPVIFDLTIAAEDLIIRLGVRRQCPVCHRTFSATAESDTQNCPHDGIALIQRADDNPATIRERLQIYQQNTGEIRRFYQKKNYYALNAAQPADVLTTEFIGILRSAQYGTKDYGLLVPNSQRLYA